MPWYDKYVGVRAEIEANPLGPRYKGRSEGNNLLSIAYRSYLGMLVDEANRQKLKLPEGATWADAIAFQTVKRAVALVGKDQICFTAITELRESTEGKNPERIVTGGNDELAALARAIAGPPADEEDKKLPPPEEGG